MNLKSKQFIDHFIGKPIAFANLVFAKSLGFVLQRNHKIEAEPNVILVIKIMGLGSVFMASDSLLALKNRYPNSKLILLTKKSLKEGLLPLNLFHEFWLVDDSNLFKLVFKSLLLIIKSWTIKKLWVLDLEVYSKLTTIFSLWTCAINRFGFYLNELSFRDKINTHNTYFNQFTIVEENYNRIVIQMGVIKVEKFSFDDFPVRALKDYKYIAINNTCSELGQERKIPDAILIELTNKLISNNFNVVFLGAPSDFNEVNQFILNNFDDNAKTNISNIIGRFNFDEYYKFLYEECSLLITIDSAPLHIAKKINVPTVSIWGPTKPETRIVEDAINKTVYLNVSCSPCVHFTETLPCGGDNFCMKKIKVEQIISAINKINHIYVE